MTEKSIEELIEQSSLGTPGAKAIRARTPLEVRDQIVERATAMATEKERKRWRKNRLARIEDLKSRISYNESEIETFRREIAELEEENERDSER